MEQVDIKVSSDSKLQISSTCSFRIRSRTRDIVEKPVASYFEPTYTASSGFSFGKTATTTTTAAPLSFGAKTTTTTTTTTTASTGGLFGATTTTPA